MRREKKNLIHLKCGAAGLGSERASVQRVPIKGTLCNIRAWMMEIQPQYNYRECGRESARLTRFTHLVMFAGLLFDTFKFQSLSSTRSTTIIVFIIKSLPEKVRKKLAFFVIHEVKVT